MWGISYSYLCSATVPSDIFFNQGRKIKTKKTYGSLVRHKRCCVHNMLPVCWYPRPPAASICFLMPTLARLSISWCTHFLPSFIGYVGYITLWFPSWHQQLFKNYVKLSVLFSPGNDIRALPLSVPLSLPIASCFTFRCHHHFANLKIPRRK